MSVCTCVCVCMSVTGARMCLSLSLSDAAVVVCACLCRSLCFFGYFAVVGELFVFVYLQEPLSQVWPYGATVYALIPFSTNLCTLCGECD